MYLVPDGYKGDEEELRGRIWLQIWPEVKSTRMTYVSPSTELGNGMDTLACFARRVARSDDIPSLVLSVAQALIRLGEYHIGFAAYTIAAIADAIQCAEMPEPPPRTPLEPENDNAGTNVSAESQAAPEPIERIYNRRLTTMGDAVDCLVTLRRWLDLSNEPRAS
jgi:hypothetical protein